MAQAEKGDIGEYVTGLGTVTPINTVTVKTRVDGQLMAVAYKEGEMVHKGEPLVEIDPRPFQVQLEQAEGQLSKDQAALAERADRSASATKIADREERRRAAGPAHAASDGRQDEATLKTDQAQIDSAKLNITYCHITAPITGRVGLRLVDPGNIVSRRDATRAARDHADAADQRDLHDSRSISSPPCRAQLQAGQRSRSTRSIAT